MAADDTVEGLARKALGCVVFGGDPGAAEDIRDKVYAWVDELAAENGRLLQWIDDLQAGTYITCVYCGHRYGPDDEIPTSMADVLKEHVEQCPEHPMSKLKARVVELEAEISTLGEFGA